MQKIRNLKRKNIAIDNIQVPEDYSLSETGITQSLIADYLACKRRFVLALNRWIHSDKILSVSFGSIAHECLDKIYHSKRIPSQKKIASFAEEYIKKNPDIYNVVDPQKLENETASVQIVLSEYVKRYDEDFADKKFISIEQSFCVMLDKFKLRGKKDAKFLLSNNDNWLMEHKSKGQITEETLMLQLTFDFQNLFYITADEIEFKTNIAGVLYNIIRKPSMRIRKNDSLQEYFDRLQEDIIARPDFYFVRFEIPYTTKDKERFLNYLMELLNEINTFCETHKKDALIMHNPFACRQPFKCQFLSACASCSMSGYSQKEKLFSELTEEE